MSAHSPNGFGLGQGLLARIAIAIPSLVLVACSALGGLDSQSVIATGIYQTQEVAGLQTQIAAAEAGNGAGKETETEGVSTPEPAEVEAQCENPAEAPDLAEIDLPENLGTLTETDGTWYLNDVEVVANYHSNEECGTQVWISLAETPDWPIYIQDENGAWGLGNSYWTGFVAVVNTNEVPLTLGILPEDIGGDESSDPQIQEMGPYEIFQVATLPPGTYTFTFEFEADEAFDLSCTLAVGSESRYAFSVVPIGVAVIEAEHEPQDAADINIETSSLCIR